MNRRGLTVAASAAALAVIVAIVLSWGGASKQSSPSPGPGSLSAAQINAAPICSRSALSATLIGQRASPDKVIFGVELTNGGGVRCRTGGWPAVQVLDAQGKPIVTAKKVYTDAVGKIRPGTFIMSPQTSVSFRVIIDARTGGGATCRHASGLSIVPPFDSAALTVKIDAMYCGWATLSALVPGTGAFHP